MKPQLKAGLRKVHVAMYHARQGITGQAQILEQGVNLLRESGYTDDQINELLQQEHKGGLCLQRECNQNDEG